MLHLDCYCLASKPGKLTATMAYQAPTHSQLQALERMLTTMHVRYAVVPCLSSLLQMWSQKFGYQPVSRAEQEALEDQIVFMDPETTYLVKKALTK